MMMHDIERAGLIESDVHVRVYPSSGLLSTVEISQHLENYGFLKEGNRVTSVGVTARSFPRIYLNLRNFQPNYVYQSIHDKIHHHVVSQLIADQIVAAKAQHRRHHHHHHHQTSPSFDLPPDHDPSLLVMVSVKAKRNLFVIRRPTKEELEETCPICFENMSTPSTDDFQLQLNCSHRFHDHCVSEWFNIQRKNSCPLCREPIYRQLQ